jgi:ribonuclease J
VLVLLSDSTNVECKGRTPGEDEVIPAFEEIFERTPGRVVVSCFATSIPRIQRVADLACQRGRAVAFVGRRMVDNTETALDLGLLRISGAHRVEAHSLNSLPPDKVTAFVSGSQGEPLSALSMVGLGEHRDLSVGPGDTVVFSARVIPGNERTVSRAIGRFYRRGCDVVHPGTARVHVSGHGSRDDLAELIRLTRPRYLIPVHGEYRMLAQHARLAAETGVPADQVLLADDGDVLAFGPWGVRREERAVAGRVLLDGASNGAVEDVVVRDRRHLSSDGIVVPVVVVDKASGRVEHAPEMVSRGFASERSDVLEEASRLLVSAIEARPPEELADPALTRERVRQELRRFFKRRMGRRPMVIPVVMEV